MTVRCREASSTTSQQQMQRRRIRLVLLTRSERVLLEALDKVDTITLDEAIALSGLRGAEIEAGIRILLVRRCVVIIEGTNPPRYALPRTLAQAPVAEEPLFVQESLPAYATEEPLVQWCMARIEESSEKRVTVVLAELVNRRGKHRANRRLRAAAAADVARYLADHGLAMTPDHRDARYSPGIEAVVTLEHAIAAGSTEDPFTDYFLSLGMAVAKADDVVALGELDELRERAEQRLAGLSDGSLDELRAIMDQIRSQPIDVAAVAMDMVSNLNRDDRHAMVEHLFDVAMADGLFLAQEEQLLRTIHQLLGTDPAHFEALVRTCKAAARAMTDKGALDRAVSPPATASKTPPGGGGREIRHLYALLTGSARPR